MIGAESGLTQRPLPEKQRIIIGRSATCDLPIDDASVSRRHAALTLGETLEIEDLGSRNGTSLRGCQLAAGEPATVKEGVVVELGSATLLLQQTRLDEPHRTGRMAAGKAPEAVVRDPTMRRLHDLLDVIAPSPLSVLLLGETGTGKEIFAEALHARSGRAKGPFVKINCAALSGSLLESELFGFEKGAFTGASSSKAGLFEAAHGGTLLLDELGELPLDTQAKILRVVENGEVRRLGSSEVRSVDVRFLGATHRDMTSAIREGRFREDLFFRLDGFSLTLPPLRKRPSEVVPLAMRFASIAAARAQRPVPLLTTSAEGALLSHAWPGNLRELRNVMERATVLSQGSGCIDASHLVFSASVESAPASARGPAPKASALSDRLRAKERERIEEALVRASGKQAEAAKLLGVSRRTLINRLDALGIDRPRKRTPST